MPMRKHIENTAAKARRRLNIFKKLARTKWGAKKQTLRHLHMGYITPTLAYSVPCCPQHSDTQHWMRYKTKLYGSSVELRGKHQQWREIECNIEPLDMHRAAAIVTTYERYERLECHPNKSFIQTGRKKTRTGQQ